jgi:iron complex outermembrane receptor protein
MITPLHDRLCGHLAARALPLAALAVASLTGLPVRAQDSEPLISSASRYGQSLYEAPASVTVITRDEIRRFGYRTLGDVLSAAGGLFTAYDRNYTYLTVRGLAKPGDFNTRILILLDGRRLNQPVDDSSLPGTEGLVDLEALDRVEILRGPGSTLYGTNAFYAVVNLVTRTGQSAKGVEVQLGGGSFESGYAAVGGGTRTAGGLDVFAIASGYGSRGPDLYYPEFDDPETNDGRAVGLDGDRFGRGLVRVMKGDFTVEGFYSTRRKEIPTASYDTVFGDPRTRSDDGGGMISGSYEHAFDDLSRVWTTATYQSGFYDGDYPYDEGLISDYLRSRWLTFEGQYQRFVGGRHRLTAGGEVRRNLRLEQGVTDAFTFRQSSWVAAGFLQGEFHLGERVTLYAGGRYDHYDTFGGTFNPRVVLVAEPATGTYLKGMYGRAFRAPSAYELYYEDGSVTQKPALTSSRSGLRRSSWPWSAASDRPPGLAGRLSHESPEPHRSCHRPGRRPAGLRERRDGTQHRRRGGSRRADHLEPLHAGELRLPAGRGRPGEPAPGQLAPACRARRREPVPPRRPARPRPRGPLLGPTHDARGSGGGLVHARQPGPPGATESRLPA